MMGDGMKEYQFERKQRFSLRKYTIGACSVLLGTSLFLALSYTSEAKAAEVKEVTAHAVDKDSLSEQIKNQLKIFEENKIEVEKGKEYYFVYKKNNLLPNTGSLSTGTALFGGALLLVCLTLVKKRKGKLIFLVSMLTVSGSVSQVMALSDFKEISPAVVKVVNGGMLPSPDIVNGYSFTGFYFEREIQTNKTQPLSEDITSKEISISSTVKKGEPLVQPEKPEGVRSEKGESLVQPEKPEGVISEKGESLVQPEKPEGVISEKGEPLVQPEKPEGVISEKGEPLVQPETPEGVVSEKGEPLVQPENLEGVISEKGEPLVQPENPEGVVSEKGEPLVQPEPPEGVVSEKGEPLVQPETPEGVISEKGESLVQPENPEGVISEKGESLVQPENPEGVISEKGESLVQPENPITEVSIKGESLVQPEPPVLEVQPEPEVKPITEEPKPHLLPVNKDLENAVNVTQASTEMKSIDLLTNEKLKSQLAPSPIEINRDLFLKRKELQKTNPAITDEEVKEVLRKEYLEKLSIKETLEETKQNIDENLKKVAAHTLSVIGDTPQNREKVERDIEDNKERILLGLSYINRFYNIDFGDTNIRDILAYNPSSFGKKEVTSLDWLKHLGSMSYDELKLTNSPKTFEKYFGKITDKQTLLDFLDYNRTTFTNMDGDTWLKKATKAIVVEKASKEKTDEKVELYTKLTTPPEKYGAEELQIKNRRQHNIATLLGLVNIKESSVYAITNIATVTYGNIGTYMDTSLEKTNKAKYTEELNKVKELIELTATRQANYVDTLYRITKPENRDKLLTNRLIIDTMKKYTTNSSAGIATTWSKESGPTADKGVKDFMTPLGLYSPSQNVGAEANGVGVRYFIDRVLDDRGSATYSHEMTHLLDRTVLFNNHGRRDGTAAEFYARGIFENSYTPEKDTYFNLNFVFDESKKNGFYNKTPDRFKTDADLRNYMHGSFDVLYSLDYLEAEATKKLSAEDKTKYFKKITPIKTKGERTLVTYTNPAVVQATHNSEKISEITLDEAKQLTDINSLIDNNILVNRYIINGFNAKGDVKANGYYLVDMFDTIFGVSENDKGMSGDITFRKQAFELMGGLGYYEGFVPYVSNQLKEEAEAAGKPLSDKYIFENILGKTYAQFKKDQINERVAKLDKLKAITINYNGKQQVIDSKEKLQSLMNEVVREEVAQIKAGNTTAQKFIFIETPVQKLKKAIYKAYLKDSDDFRQSIYNS